MKKILLAAFAVLLFPALAQAGIRPPAEPVSALFYPNEVQVTVEERLAPEALPGSRGFIVPLPVRAVQSSFSVTVNGSPAGSYYLLNREEDILALEEPGAETDKPAPPVRIATRPEQESNPERRALLQSIADIRIEAEQYSADLNAANERLGRWKNYTPPDDPEVKPSDVIALDKTLGELLPGLYATKSKAERLLQGARERLGEAEQDLRAYDAGLSPQSRLVAVVPYTESAGKPCVLRYTYILPGSYRNSYHVGAFPSDSKLSIEQNAALSQASGFTWNDVDVFISTTGRDTALQPYGVQPWIISLGTPYVEDARDYSRKDAMPMATEVNMSQMANQDMVLERSAAAPAPRQEEMGTFRLWSIGKRTIESGQAVNVTMAKESYDAKFYYTLRPSISSKGFLTAELSLDSALELPLGNARFFVDNSLVGEQRMSINGSKATLYFGTDPQVVATRKDIKHTTGEQGFISKEQSILWHWEITVRNTRSRAIEAWVEDARPDAQDNAVKLTVESSPKPEEVTLKPQQGGAKVYRWVMTVEPNETKTIDHKVQILAPSDKQLNPGRHN